MRIIEILTNILYYPFENKMFNISDMSNEIQEIIKVKFYISIYLYLLKMKFTFSNLN